LKYWFSPSFIILVAPRNDIVELLIFQSNNKQPETTGQIQYHRPKKAETQ